MTAVTDEILTLQVEQLWGVALHDYAGEFAPVDAYAVRGGEFVAYVERKTRPDVPHDRYPTAVLDVRKWLGLISAEFATGHPAFLVYGWSNGVWGAVRPSLGIPVTTSILTPGLDSRSYNRGVPRPVVEIPISWFALQAVNR